MTDPEPTSADHSEVVTRDETETGSATDSEAAITDPDQLMKQKYREAMAHKHGTSGATKQEHGDSGSSGHSQSAGPSQRMFRRKAGG